MAVHTEGNAVWKELRMTRTVQNSERPETAASETKVQTTAPGRKRSRFCEVLPAADAEKQASVRIELGPDITIEIRRADRSLLEEYLLEVLTGS